MAGKSKYKTEIRNGIQFKECAYCHEMKPLSDFYPNVVGRALFGVTTGCKICTNNNSKERYNKDKINQSKLSADRQLISKYGITREQYIDKYNNQEGRCLICQEFQETLVIDHNHTTNEVRGLICANCNMAIGLVKENIRTLERMIFYIKINE